MTSSKNNINLGYSLVGKTAEKCNGFQYMIESKQWYLDR